VLNPRSNAVVVVPTGRSVRPSVLAAHSNEEDAAVAGAECAVSDDDVY
jgi:ribosomal protein L1